MTDPDIAADTARLQAEAAELPTPEQLRDLAARAVAHGGTRNMSPDEIREIASQAVEGLEKVTALLRRLSQLSADPAHSPWPHGGEQ